MKKTLSTDGISDVVSWGVQIGRTKVFLREQAFVALEELRISAMNTAASQLQTRIRSYLCRSRFLLLLRSVITIQCATRRMVATSYVSRLRCNLRAMVIQKYWRTYSCWSQFQNVLFLATWCQRVWRGRKVRQSFCLSREYRASTGIVSEREDMSLVLKERDQLRLEMMQMRHELEEIKRDHTIIHSSSTSKFEDSLSKASDGHPQVRNKTRSIPMLCKKCIKKDRERCWDASSCGSTSTQSHSSNNYDQNDRSFHVDQLTSPYFCDIFSEFFSF